MFKQVEDYKIIITTLEPKIEELKSRQRKRTSKEGKELAYIPKFHGIEDYLSYFQRKLEKANQLGQVMCQQINGLNDFIGNKKRSGLKGKSEINLKQLRLHIRRLIKTIMALDREWEESLYITPPNILHKIHNLLCDIYKSIFDELFKFIDAFSNIVHNPESIVTAKQKRIILKFEPHLPPKFNDQISEEFSKLENKLKAKVPIKKSSKKSTRGTLISDFLFILRILGLGKRLR